MILFGISPTAQLQLSAEAILALPAGLSSLFWAAEALWVTPEWRPEITDGSRNTCA